jgi:hypothetical protein
LISGMDRFSTAVAYAFEPVRALRCFAPTTARTTATTGLSHGYIAIGGAAASQGALAENANRQSAPYRASSSPLPPEWIVTQMSADGTSRTVNLMLQPTARDQKADITQRLVERLYASTARPCASRLDHAAALRALADLTTTGGGRASLPSPITVRAAGSPNRPAELRNAVYTAARSRRWTSGRCRPA